MGVTREALGRWSPKYSILFHNIFPILQKRRAVVEYEHGDVVETQTILLYLCDMYNNMHITKSFLANSVPAKQYSCYTTLNTLKY